jgi:hypothetical protein
LQHFDIELLRDGLDVLGLEPVDELVHRFAPRPEIIGRMAAPLGEARHRALESVRVDVSPCPG